MGEKTYVRDKTLFEEFDVEFPLSQEGSIYGFDLTSTGMEFPVELGKTYEIIFNDIDNSYYLTPVEKNLIMGDTINLLLLGNSALLGIYLQSMGIENIEGMFEDTGEPFLLIKSNVSLILSTETLNGNTSA